jgi:acetyl esterase/lipase
MKRTLLLILLSAAFMAAPSVYSSAQSICKLKPTMTVFLYPDGQEESNGITEPEWNDETGRIGNISDSARVDIYLPKKCNGQMVVVCPGGGYRYVSALKEGLHVADWMVNRGIAVAVVKHRMPNGHWELPLEDVQNVFRHCRANAEKWGINQIGVMGFSAGGHLAASVSTLYIDKVTRPDFSVLIYPVVSLDRKFVGQGTRNNLLGKDEMWDDNDMKVAEYEEKQKSYSELLNHYSLQNHIDSNTPEAFIVHCSDDKQVPVEHSIMYYTRLIDSNVGAEMHIYPKGGHGWGFSSEKWKGKGNDKFAYARMDFEAALERWLENIRTK